MDRRERLGEGKGRDDGRGKSSGIPLYKGLLLKKGRDRIKKDKVLFL